MTPGWVARAAAAGTELVRTVRSTSGGSSSTSGLGRGAGVEEDGAAGGQLVEDAGGDPALDLGAAGGAGGEGGLELEALDRDGAPVHPAERAAPLEGGEVAAHRLGGHAERVGERGDLHPTGTARLREDALLTLRCVHRTPSSPVLGAPSVERGPSMKPLNRPDVKRYGRPFLWLWSALAGARRHGTPVEEPAATRHDRHSGPIVTGSSRERGATVSSPSRPGTRARVRPRQQRPE